MLAIKTCSFCGKDVGAGEGIMYVRNDGLVNWYCSSKCRKNSMKLKRDARKLKWTLHHRGKEKKS